MLKDFGGILKQAQKMQKELQRVQEELKERVVEASAGGGMVIVQVNGQRELVSIKIDPEVVKAEDVGMLEDLVQAAVNQAMVKASELAKEELGKLTGGLPLNLPGLM
jgi:DNA-binding YbaB/EbfC family protein